MPFPLFITHTFPFHRTKKRKSDLKISRTEDHLLHTSSNSTLSSLAAERELFFLGVLAMELEDDLFFADLSKQISLLIMDDDDEDPSVSFQAFSRGNYPSAPSHFMYEQNCRRESCKGTGVFIPKSSQPRRKHRQGRYSQKSNNRQHDNTRVVSQVSYSNAFKSKKS